MAASALGLALGRLNGWVEFVVAGTISATLLLLSIPFLFSARTLDVNITLGHDRVSVGTPVSLELAASNSRRGMTLPGRVDVPIGDGLVDVYVPLLRRGSQHRETVDVPTHRRGIIAVGPARTVRGDPLGIFKREVNWHDAHTLYVHPLTTALPSTATGYIRDLEGNPSSLIAHEDISFHAIREYVPGDAQRQVHWKSTAKTGTLMVRQYEETRRSRMVIALGLDEAEYATDEEFELAVSVAASIGIRGLRDGREVHVVIGGESSDAARRATRPIRELTTVSSRILLDELSAVERSASASPLTEMASLASDAHSDASIAILVCGSTPTARMLQAAAMEFASNVGVIAVLCNPKAKPGFRALGPVSVMSVGLLEDLRQLLAKGAKS